MLNRVVFLFPVDRLATDLTIGLEVGTHILVLDSAGGLTLNVLGANILIYSVEGLLTQIIFKIVTRLTT